MTRKSQKSAAIEGDYPETGQPIQGPEDIRAEIGLYKEIGYFIRMSQLVLFDDLLGRLKGIDLTLSQLTVLRFIDARPGLSQQRVGDALLIKKPNLVTLIDKLEKQKLVARRPVPTDKRTYALHLTEPGQKMLKLALMAIEAHQQAIATILAPEEQTALMSALGKIIDQLPAMSSETNLPTRWRKGQGRS